MGTVKRYLACASSSLSYTRQTIARPFPKRSAIFTSSSTSESHNYGYKSLKTGVRELGMQRVVTMCCRNKSLS